MNRFVKTLCWCAAVVGLPAFALSIALVARGSARPVNDQDRWVAVAPQEQRFELAVTGRIAPARLVEIASPATGTMSDVKLTFGASVSKGQRVLRVASPELDGQLRSAEAAWLRSQLEADLAPGQEPAEMVAARRRLLSAQSALQTARSRAADSEALYARGFVSRMDKEATATELENARAQLDTAEDEVRTVSRKYSTSQLRAQALESAGKKAELEQLRQRQLQLDVVAPIDGVVLPPASREGGQQAGVRELVHGARVNAGETLLTIGDTSSFVVQATCSEADMAWLEIGLPARVEIASLPGRPFEARLSRLAASFKQGQSLGPQSGPEFDCEFAFAGADQPLSEDERRRLRIGGSAAVRVSHVGQARQTTVPLAALAWSGDGRAQLRWRSAPGAAAETMTVQVAGVSVDEVQLREALEGEVWVGKAASAAHGAEPGAAAEGAEGAEGRSAPASFLSRMLGGEP